MAIEAVAAAGHCRWRVWPAGLSLASPCRRAGGIERRRGEHVCLGLLSEAPVAARPPGSGSSIDSRCEARPPGSGSSIDSRREARALRLGERVEPRLIAGGKRLD